MVKMYELDTTEAQAEAATAAAAEFRDYVVSLIEERRREPRDDLVTRLVEARVEGERLSDAQIVSTIIVLLNAGHEATVNVVGNGLLALLNNPDQLDRLRADPSLIPGAVEELIRFDAPLQLFERTAMADTQIGDVSIPAGTKIAALLGSANHDPSIFSDPSRLDVGRADNPHLGFGAGIHFCVGAPLARVELQVSLTTLLTRFASIEAAGPAQRRPEFVIRGLHRLPVNVG
jgi:cytochrome P450